MPQHVVIAGGGFGGYYTAKALERRTPKDVRITLVSDVNFMLYTPLLPGAAAGTLDPRHVVVPLRERLKRTELRLGWVTGGCGDNHATCSVYNQNITSGVRPPHLGEWIINLGEAAEYMFDHNIYQENLVGVDYCEKMVPETNPGVLARANATEAPHAA